ncbi:MAG: winged helix-turn-helix transcriptional regulator [Actinomycetales bacterium]|nr:winged helix-turn-helix transcriptional regulator [Actinomycetales bacterium]
MSDHLSTGTPPGSTPEPESLPHEAVAPPPATEELPHTAYVAQWRQTDTLRALRELLALSEQVAPVLARRADLGQTDLRALELLVENPHGPVELANRLGVTSAAASGIVDRMQARGHVVRAPHPTDGRRTQVVLTQQGREELLGHLVPMFILLAEVDSALSESDRVVVQRYLDGAIRAVRQVLGPDHP